VRLTAILGLAAVAAPPLPAQTLHVYSEFRRVGPDGAVVQPDSVGRPREIISPAVARNGFASLRLVVSVPQGKHYTLHLGDNPDGSFQYTLYKEHPSSDGSPADRLEKLSLPYEGVLPDPAFGLPGQSASSFWLDVWVPAKTKPSRIRVEAQLNVGQDWIIYPMEFRVQSATIPKHAAPLSPLAAATVHSSQSAFGPMQAYLCEKAPTAPPSNSLTIRHLIRRNAAQDMALARSLEPALGAATLRSELLQLIGAPDLSQWCGARLSPSASYDPEKYLRVRDCLYATAVK
jgi:hypothetical protein